MIPFLYFLPDQPGKPPRQPTGLTDQLDCLGLGHLKGGSGLTGSRIKGPGDQQGVLIATPDYAGQRVYTADTQNWRRDPQAPPRFWAGMDKGREVDPESLKRPDGVGGTPVTLADGREWMIPILVGVLPDRRSSLPMRLDMDDDGEVAGRVHDQYQGVVDQAWNVWLEFSGDAAEPVEFKAKVQLAAEAISLNYRVGFVEIVGLLRLLDTTSLMKVMRTLIDADAVEAHVRGLEESGRPKAESGVSTAGDDSSTNSGGRAGAATSTPPSPG